MKGIVKAKLAGKMCLIERVDTRKKSHVRVLNINNIPEDVLSVDDYKPGFTVLSQSTYLDLRYQGIIQPVSRVAKGVLVKLLF